MKINFIYKTIIYLLFAFASLCSSYFLITAISNAYFRDDFYSGLDVFRFIAFPAAMLTLSAISVESMRRKNLNLLALVAAISPLVTLATWFSVIGYGLIMGSPEGRF